MTTPTPRTDAAWASSFNHPIYSSAHTARTMRDECAKLEAELATERARLDWLEKSDPDSLHWWTVGEPNSIRDDIDAAMKEDRK